MLSFALLVLGFAAYSLYRFPTVSLNEEGICVRVLLKTRRYSWKTIKQAGVLWQLIKGRHPYNQMVLLKQNGSPRKYKDKTFCLRNIGKIIYLPVYNEEIRQYVITHYGPLDFDLSDGRDEQSIVVD